MASVTVVWVPMRIRFIWLPVFALVCSIGSLPAKPANIIVILADDLGYADLGCQGSGEVKSPQIDSIARHGVRFTAGYVTAPQCCPSRAGLITGRYQNRFGFEANWSASAAATAGLPLGEKTIGDQLRAAGYVTGMIGKWHLGSRPEMRPQQRGFDESLWLTNGGILNPNPKTGFLNDLRRGDVAESCSEYSTDAFGKEAVDFIDRHHAAERPFFLYLSFVPPHWPMEAKPEHMQQFSHIPDLHRRTMLAMMASLDENVGRVLAKLREEKIEENTMVFFLSDNGGPTGAQRAAPDAAFEYGQNTSRNTPLRGVKGDLLEGGIRVPFLMQWKGHLPAGKVVDAPVSSLDILPTALAVAEGKAIAPLDGVNLIPYLTKSKKEAPHEMLFWRFRFPPAQPAQHRWAVRQGDWKLVKNRAEPLALYHLTEDIGERHNLAAQEPARVAEMKAAYGRWDAQNREPLWTDAKPNPKRKPEVRRK
jgi:arylsulfatase A-like enzyme